MPQDRPGVLGDEVYAQFLAFVYQENGSEPGETPLPTDPAELQAMASPSWSLAVLPPLAQSVPPSVKRGISIYGDRLFVPTSDAHVVALDTKTGSVVWDQALAELESGIRLTGGTLVAKGKVMVGTTGRTGEAITLLGSTPTAGRRFGGSALSPRPEEPGGNSWNALPLEERNVGRSGYREATTRSALSRSSDRATCTTPVHVGISSIRRV